MAEEGRKVARGLGIVAILGGAILLATKAKAAPPVPPEPPEPGLANLYGVVADTVTGVAVPGVLVTLNGIETHTFDDGSYSLVDLEPRGYDIVLSKEGYEPFNLFNVAIIEGNNELNVELTPIVLPEPPTPPTPPTPPEYPELAIASCVYDGAQFSTENDLIAHMEANHPGKPYIVWAYLPEENVLLTPGSQYSINAKVFAPPTTEDEGYIYAFWSYKWECIASWIYVGKGTPEGFYIGEAASYHCLHRLGKWYCPPLGENIVYSDCYLAGVDRWYSNPVWKSVDIGLRVNFTA